MLVIKAFILGVGAICLSSWNYIGFANAASVSIESATNHTQFAGTCAKDITDETFLIQNPGYPSPYSGAKSFIHRIKVQPGMAGIRFYYNDLVLARERLEKSCSTDFIYFLMDGYITQPNCGALKDFQTSIPAKPGQTVTLVISAQSDAPKWNILCTQIPDESVRFSPLKGLDEHCGDFKEYEEPLEEESPVESPLPSHNISFVDPLSDPICSLSGNAMTCRLHNYLHQIVPANATTDDRIINGEDAKPGNYPWMAALIANKKDFFCAGTLISPNMVLTAGHCMNYAMTSLKRENLQIVIGSLTIGTYGRSSIVRQCDYISYHPRYRDIFYDVAACHFKDPVKFTASISPVCLPSITNETYAGSEGYISGWGKTGDNSGPSKTLKYAQLPISTNQKCRSAWNEIAMGSFQDLIQDYMMCGGGAKSATCNGDSGGPLHIKDDATNKYTQVGIVSFGPSTTCLPLADRPLSVFSRMTYFMPDLLLWSAIVPVSAHSEEKIFTSC